MVSRGLGGLDEAVVQLLDAAPTPIVAVDPDGLIGYVNAPVVDQYGYAAAELLGEPVEVLVPDRLRSRHAQLRTAYGAEPRLRSAADGQDYRVRHSDGRVLPAEISLLPLRTAGGTWVVASVRDLSHRARAEQQLRDSNRAYLTLARTNAAIVRAPDRRRLFEETCRIVVVQGGYLGAWIGVPEGGRVVPVASAGALEEYVEQLRIVLDEDDPRGRGPTAVAMREGRPYFSGDFAADATTAPWQRLAAPYGIAASATVPLRCGGRVVSVLSLYSARPHVFDDQMRELLLGMAENLSFALDGFDRQQRLVEVAEERTLLAERLIEAQEEERGRIAADLHDESVQALASVDLRLGLLARRARAESAALVPDVERAQRSVALVGEQLRDLLFDLESPDPGVPLEQLVLEVTHHLFEGTGVRTRVTSNEHPGSRPLSPAVRAQALRIVREALLNARKHAGAAEVEVHLEVSASGAEISVSDDGTGFEATTTSAPGHRGLKNMADRAAVAGGWWRVEPGDPGTVVRFWVPLRSTEGDGD